MYKLNKARANKMIKTIITGTVVAGLFGIVAYAAAGAIMLPDVEMSYETGYCTKVINYAQGDAYNCENMPIKFNHVWVK